jgi:hypothetical protein
MQVLAQRVEQRVRGSSVASRILPFTLKETFDIAEAATVAWPGAVGVWALTIDGAAVSATDAAVPNSSLRRDNSKSLGPCMSCSRFAVAR